MPFTTATPNLVSPYEILITNEQDRLRLSGVQQASSGNAPAQRPPLQGSLSDNVEFTFGIPSSGTQGFVFSAV